MYLPYLYHTFEICVAQVFLCLSQGSTPSSWNEMIFLKFAHLDVFEENSDIVSTNKENENTETFT